MQVNMKRSAMKKGSNRGFVIQIVLGMAIGTMFGCASGRTNLVDNGTVIIESAQSMQAFVTSVSVYRDDEKLVISGRVKQRYHTVTADRGHVDIALINPDGTTIRTVSVGYRSLLARRTCASSLFRVCLPVTLPQGATVRVVHHSTPNLC